MNLRKIGAPTLLTLAFSFGGFVLILARFLIDFAPAESLVVLNYFSSILWVLLNSPSLWGGFFAAALMATFLAYFQRIHKHLPTERFVAHHGVVKEANELQRKIYSPGKRDHGLEIQLEAGLEYIAHEMKKLRVPTPQPSVWGFPARDWPHFLEGLEKCMQSKDLKRARSLHPKD
ncbi:MAG: hypothetical protein F4Y47_22335 [Acidobacteriia bacterium]|nr:hypothetical protein [Terriglobia bacterium]MYG04894.1 hypothetical protein [Terriglobia bacterium]MYK09346.1 hypothetical protein [Terriglobia bacterium]